MAQYYLIESWFKPSLSSVVTALIRGALFGSVSLASLLLLVALHQRTIVINKPSQMIHKRIYDMCRSGTSLSSELDKHPGTTPHAIIEKLYKHHDSSSRKASEDEERKSFGLEQAYECGNWGSKYPSDLFLQIYHDALCTLEKNPMSGLASPSLLGSSGVVPLTIIAPLPDICRHMSNCIVRAEKEIFLATNYWISSRASKLITNALKELSERAGKRKSRVVVKIIYDRGDPRQVCKNRLKVYPKAASDEKVNLPAPDEIPNIDLEVINYHKPITGTFHSKYMIVDRRIALLQSNNIQDNDNLEMMIRVEGPVVDSLYDHALVSWNTELEPQLPMIHSPASSEEPVSFPQSKVGATKIKNRKSTERSTIHANRGGTTDDKLREHTQDDPHYDADIESEAERVNSTLIPRGSESVVDAVTRHLNIISRPDVTGDAPEWNAENDMKPYILHEPHEPFPMALVCREPWGALNHSSIYTPQNASFLAAINNSKKSLLLQTPNLNAEPLLEPLLNAVRRGVEVTCYLCLGYNDAGQLLPFQNGTNEMVSKRLYSSLISREEKDRLKIYNYVGKDQTRPIHNKFKARSCHIKLMIVDQCVAIQGNGNLDTQSFYHSQETNLLLDSTEVCKTWLDAIQRNQNTAQYGAVSSEDGCWHDPDTGKIATGSLGVKPGRFSWVRGIVGAVQRVRGTGGF